MEKIKPYLAFFIPILLLVILITALNEGSKSARDYEFDYTDDAMSNTDSNVNVDNLTNNTQNNDVDKTVNKGPEMIIDISKIYKASVKTTEGDFVIELNAAATPVTVNNFVTLAKKGFYSNTIFHRVIKGFMIQGGDPDGNGTGGPGYKFNDEPITGEYTRGTVAMANSGPNTNGSQFFIMHDTKPLQKAYVIFGKVVTGLETIDKIAEAKVSVGPSGEESAPVAPVKILEISIVEQ